MVHVHTLMRLLGYKPYCFSPLISNSCELMHSLLSVNLDGGIRPTNGGDGKGAHYCSEYYTCGRRKPDSPEDSLKSFSHGTGWNRAKPPPRCLTNIPYP